MRIHIMQWNYCNPTRIDRITVNIGIIADVYPVVIQALLSGPQESLNVHSWAASAVTQNKSAIIIIILLYEPMKIHLLLRADLISRFIGHDEAT